MTVEAVTPKMAQQWLGLTAGNRVVRKRRIERYCRDRRAGNWYVTHQGIAFDSDGLLRDGHHRLEMIVATNLTTKMAVFRNVPSEGLTYIDAGLARSSRDALYMADKGNYSNTMMAVARGLFSFPGHSRSPLSDPTNTELVDRLARHGESLNYACAHLPHGISGVSRSTRVLVARAWYSADRERLSEFCVVVTSGVPQDPRADLSGITFRNFLIKTAKNTGWALEEERYRKGQTALDSFLKRQPLEKLYGTPADLFPMPEES